MSKTLIITHGETSITVKRPSFPYVIKIINGIRYVLTRAGKLRAFDHESSYRILDVDDWYLKADQQDDFEDIVKVGNVITLTLGAGSGFYPHGPDYGDEGEYQFTVRSVIPSGMLYSPYKHFRNRVELVCKSLGSPAILPKKSQGSLEIGNIDGLKNPQFEINYSRFEDRAARTDNSGTVDTVHTENVGHSSALKINLNTANASRLCPELVNEIRGSAFYVRVPQAYNLFGRGVVNPAGEYLVRADLSEVEFRHLGFNRWETDLTVHYEH